MKLMSELTQVLQIPGFKRSSAELKVNLNGLNESRIKVVKSESGDSGETGDSS